LLACEGAREAQFSFFAIFKTAIALTKFRLSKQFSA